jgi:hypothetical protein
VAVAGAPTLAVRPQGSTGRTVVYDLASAKQLFKLPAGALSADGKRYFVTRIKSASTTVARYDARSGRPLGSASVAGRWWLNTISADGSLLALKRIVKGRATTSELALMNGRTGKLIRRLTLRGNLEVEAIAPAGRRLFLVQWLRRGYVVRAYDLRARRLTSIRAGNDPAIMRGTAWGSVASSDGRWLLTLYLEPDGETAIHALDVRRGRAACIDLPAGSFEAARDYGFLVVGGTALAINPTLGIVARVDLTSDRMVAISRFRPSSDLTGFGTVGAVAGNRAFFSGGSSVWSYELNSGIVTGPREVGERVIGLAYTPDGSRIRAVRADGTIVSLGR